MSCFLGEKSHLHIDCCHILKIGLDENRRKTRNVWKRRLHFVVLVKNAVVTGHPESMGLVFLLPPLAISLMNE
jgi:hypothetical protein